MSIGTVSNISGFKVERVSADQIVITNAKGTLGAFIDRLDWHKPGFIQVRMWDGNAVWRSYEGTDGAQAMRETISELKYRA